MAKQSSSSQRESRESHRPNSTILAWAVVIAVASALWALFQWSELVSARSGGEAFCGFGPSTAGCSRAWDLPFARGVERLTGLPVAGWGLAWSLVAFALPLCALARRARGRSSEPFWSAAWLSALMGAVSVVVLAVALFQGGVFCANCLVTYVLVLGYASLCLLGGQLRSFARGLPIAAGAAVLAFLALLYPGLLTPPAGEDRPAPPAATARARPDAPPLLPELALPRPGRATSETTLVDLVRELPPSGRQALADALARYAAAPAVSAREARALVGPADAPVRITEFTDVQCGHCASLHHTLRELRRVSPPDSFAIESRQFPLDGSCNPEVLRASRGSVRCVAARALVCMEGRPEAFDFADVLFAAQLELTEEKVLQAAEVHLPREELEACLADPETEKRLLDDIAWATEHGIRGTPLVLVNGRQAPAMPSFLYALVLARGDLEHPALASLPPARTPAAPGR